MAVAYIETCSSDHALCGASDTELVAAVRAGDERAWEIIVGRYQPMIMGVCRRHRLFGTDAADVCQFTWTRLIENCGKLRDPRALAGWIATTAARACLETIRSRQRAISIDPTGTEGMDRPVRLGALGPAGVDHAEVDEQLLRAERCEAVREGMAELNGNQQQLLLMLVADPPVPYAEISERMGVPMGSIGPTRARLLAKLRKTLAVRSLYEELPAAA